MRLLASRHEVPEELYEASLIVGATNVAEILDIDRLAPGTIVVDDSAPHVFRSDEALRRFRERGDILVTEGGVLAAPSRCRSGATSRTGSSLAEGRPGRRSWRRPTRGYITGCVLSGLLSARFAHLTPTIGLIDRRTALRPLRDARRARLQGRRTSSSADTPLDAADRSASSARRMMAETGTDGHSDRVID